MLGSSHSLSQRRKSHLGGAEMPICTVRPCHRPRFYPRNGGCSEVLPFVIKRRRRFNFKMTPARITGRRSMNSGGAHAVLHAAAGLQSCVCGGTRRVESPNAEGEEEDVRGGIIDVVHGWRLLISDWIHVRNHTNGRSVRAAHAMPAMEALLLLAATEREVDGDPMFATAPSCHAAGVIASHLRHWHRREQ